MFKVHRVQEVQRVTKVSRDQSARWDKGVRKETKVCLGQLELKEKKVLLDHQVHPDQKVHLGHGVFQGQKVHEVLWADLEFLVKRGTRVFRDFLVGMDIQAYRDQWEHRGSEDQQDLQE